MLFLLLPVYNEEENLHSIIHDLRSRLQGADYLIIAVNDGSVDRSLEILHSLKADDLLIRSSPVNMNVGAVFLTGIDQALALSSRPDDVLIIMEADQTSSMEGVVRLAETLQNQNQDIVIASRYRHEKGFVDFPLYRRILSRCASWLMQHWFPIDGHVTDYTIFFRAYRMGLLRRGVELYGKFGLIQSKGFVANAELLVKLAMLTNRISEVPFVYDYGKKKGHSKLRVLKTIGGYFMAHHYLKDVQIRVRKLNLSRFQ